MSIGFRRINSGQSHSYQLAGEDVPGVTTIVGLLDKPALVGWAARETAAYADEHWDRLALMRSADRIRELERARFGTNQRAILRGSRIHWMAEQMQHGYPITDCPPELEPDVRAVAELLDRWKAVPVLTEAPVASLEHWYAGTVDAVMQAPGLPTAVWDWKTGRGVYDEVALQLAAYARCDLRLEEVPQVGPRGGRRPSLWVERPMVELDDPARSYVVHVRDGVAALHPVDTDDDVFAAFRHLSEVWWLWHRRIAQRGNDWYQPTIHEPIYPEQRPEGIEE